MARFDTAYVTVMNCNWKQIRYDYPHLHRWLRYLYWEVDDETKGAFKHTTHLDIVSEFAFLVQSNIELFTAELNFERRLLDAGANVESVYGRIHEVCDEIEARILGPENANPTI